ncbi:hypothetical protein CCMSSC00406_0009252 [Pleurotus cornucopiae]|uniref:Uncharacterized protein n=1 Tax=Pleurotus cornucopiae TaxID=5321 RepID=A0ACB7J115_PLECO|nr:hypothetical protein CCMSSC00406_0009252 [Pleurotus cornucopiae]
MLLLQTKDLTGKWIAQHWHLIMWRHLGPDRPALITAIEHHIWNAVVQLASSPGLVSEVMKSLYDDIKLETQYDKKSHAMQVKIPLDELQFFRRLKSLFPPPNPPAPSTSASNPPPSPTGRSTTESTTRPQTPLEGSDPAPPLSLMAMGTRQALTSKLGYGKSSDSCRVDPRRKSIPEPHTVDLMFGRAVFTLEDEVDLLAVRFLHHHFDERLEQLDLSEQEVRELEFVGHQCGESELVENGLVLNHA